MRRFRARRSVALLAVGALLFAAVALWASPDPLAAILPPACLVFALVSIVVIRRCASRCDDQPVSLLSLLLSRAPPAWFALA